MKIFLLFLLLFVSGPLLCEENSLLGYRLVWNNSKGKVTYLRLRKMRKRVFIEYPSVSDETDWSFLEINYNHKFTLPTKQI